MHRSRIDSRRRFAGFLITTVVFMLGLGLPAQALDKPGDTPSPVTRVDINQATADELTVLPGIGPAMARRIVAFRDEHGPFRRVEDLMKVKGIGEKSFQKLRPAIKVARAD